MKKKILLIIIILLFVGLIFGGIIFFCNSKKTELQKIATEIAKERGYDKINYESADMSYKYSYNEVAIIKYDGSDAISVAKYNSEKEAKAKRKYIIDSYKIYHEKYDNTVVSKMDIYDNIFENEKDKIFTVGKYLINVNSEFYHDSIKSDIKKIVNKYNKEPEKNILDDDLKKYWNKQIDLRKEKANADYDLYLSEAKKEILNYLDLINNCKDNDCDKYFKEIEKYENYDEVKDEFEKVKNKYNEEINKKKSIIDSINSKLSNIEKNLNKNEYDELKKEIENLDDSYYDSYKTEWNKKLSNIEKDVFKKSCKNYSYKDLLRNPSDYQGKNAYFFGEVVQKIGSSDYRVNINCKKYSFSSDYYCDDTIYMTYSGDVNLIEDDMIKVWGVMNGTQTYETVLGANVTVPKFNAKYVNIQ